MAQDWTQLGVTVAGAAVGVLLSLLLSRGGTSGRSVDGSTVHGDVHQGDDNRRYKVRVDKRTINKVNAPVWIDARQTVPAGPPAPLPQAASPGTDESGWEKLAAVGLVLVLCVVGYVRNRDLVIDVAMSVQLFAFSIAVSALLVARVRSVVYSAGVNIQLLLDLVMGGVALLGLRWLVDPPFAASAGNLQAVFSDGAQLGFTGLLQRFGGTAVLFITHQLAGLIFSSLAMAFVVFHALKVYVAASIAVRTANDLSHVPSSFSRWLLRAGGTASGCWTAAVIASVFGAVLVSGLGYELFEQLQAWSKRWTPATVPGA